MTKREFTQWHSYHLNRKPTQDELARFKAMDATGECEQDGASR